MAIIEKLSFAVFDKYESLLKNNNPVCLINYIRLNQRHITTPISNSALREATAHSQTLGNIKKTNLK